MADNGQQYEQLNIFDLLKISAVSNASSSDLTSLIGRLQSVQREKEREERAERERRQREYQIEQQRKARAAQEERERLEKERKEQHIRDVTSMELAMDWENFYVTDETVAQNHVESIPDGFIKCLNAKGCVDIEYIAAISGSDCKTVIERLKGSIYQNPNKWGECFYKGWETAEEYLSGNVRKKLASAKTANEEYSGYFKANVDALSKVVPPKVCAEEIYVTLGSPWVPAKYLTQFVRELREEKIV